MKLALVSLAALACLTSCTPHRDLPILGQVTDFRLVSQEGLEFDRRELLGHVWVADFIFTTCPGPCPRMSSMMHKLQIQTSDVRDIRLVSFTVDPAHDLPAVLHVYATRYQAEPARWTFLTGDVATLQHLSRDVLKLGDVDGSLNHSTRLVLMDQKCRIRGYYGTAMDDPVSQVAADARQLRKEPN